MRQRSNRRTGFILRVAVSWTLVGALSSSGGAQLREVLDDLLGKSDEIKGLQEIEKSDGGAAFLVTLGEIDSPEGVEVTMSFLDTSLRRLDGFRSETLSLGADVTEVPLEVAYEGTSEARSAIAEVTLTRNGRRFARRRFPMVHRWAGSEGYRSELSSGEESDEDVSAGGGGGDAAPEVIELSPQPLGNTPRHASAGGPEGSAGDTSGGTSGTTPGSGGMVLRLPPGGVAGSSTCHNAVQGKVAWDYSGNKTWASANIDRLCQGATHSEEPARCFQRVMHGGINWGGGTRWQWKNAVDLCEGSTNAAGTVACFQQEVKRAGGNWTKAIDVCGK